MSILPIAVIGAGPVGLAAAAHLAERGLPFVVLEAGDRAGSSVREWGHVRLFSPWRYDIDPAAAKLLADAGWNRPDDDRLPTGAELADDYLQPLADLPDRHQDYDDARPPHVNQQALGGQTQAAHHLVDRPIERVEDPEPGQSVGHVGDNRRDVGRRAVEADAASRSIQQQRQS